MTRIGRTVRELDQRRSGYGPAVAKPSGNDQHDPHELSKFVNRSQHFGCWQSFCSVIIEVEPPFVGWTRLLVHAFCGKFGVARFR